MNNKHREIFYEVLIEAKHDYIEFYPTHQKGYFNMTRTNFNALIEILRTLNYDDSETLPKIVALMNHNDGKL